MNYKKLVIYSFFHLFLIHYGFSQDKEITKDGFDKAIDLANYKYVEYSIENDNKKQNFISSCNYKNDLTYNKIKEAISKEDTKTIQFSEEFNKLKNEEVDLKKRYIANFLTEDIFSDKYKDKFKNIYEYGVKRKKDNSFNKLKSDLNGNIINLLNEHTLVLKNDNTSQKPQSVIKDDQDTNQSESVSKKSSWFDGFTFQIDVFSILLSILLSIILIGFLYDKYFSDDEITKEYIDKKIKKELSNFKFLNSTNNSNQNYNYLKRDFEKLKSEFIQLKRNQNIANQSSNKPNYTRISRPEEVKPKNIFYLSTPNDDGSFNENSAHFSFSEGKSIYKFTKISESKANFVIDNRSISFATKYPDIRIDPCCNPLNAFNPNALKIITDTPGIAELNNGQWVLITKAEIRYEN